jgi:hypothetical protein
VTWSVPITRDNNGAENDFFLDAKIMLGNSATAMADNTLATWSSDDLYLDQGKTLWFRWKAPVTSAKVRIRTSGSAYHHRTIMFTGPQAPLSASELTYFGWFDDHKGFNYPNEDLGITSISVIQGTDYYFMMDSEHPTTDTEYAPNEGRTSLEITVGAGAATDEVASSEATDSSQAPSTAIIGASQARAAQVATLATSSRPILRAAADVTLQVPQGSNEGFSLGVNVAGKRTAGLVFRAEDQGIQALSPQGLSTSTGQAFIPGEPMHVEVTLDRARRHWSVSLEGIIVAEGEGVSPMSFAASELVAEWLPGTSRSGTLEVSKATLLADDLPPAALPVSTPRSLPTRPSDDEKDLAASPPAQPQ